MIPLNKICGTVCIGLLVISALLFHQLGESKEQIGSLESGLITAVNANQSLDDSYQSLLVRYNNLVLENQTNLQAISRVERQWLSDRQTLNAELEDARNNVRVIYETDQEAAEWSDVPTPIGFVSIVRENF